MQHSEQSAPVENKVMVLRQKIRRLLLFPVVVVSIANLTFIALLLLVIPRLRDIFPGTGFSSTIETQFIMAASGFCQTYWFVVLPIILLGPIFFAWLFLKPFAEMIKKYAIVEIAENSLALVRSGRPLEEALLVSATPVAKDSLPQALSESASPEFPEKTKTEACLEKIISHSEAEAIVLVKRIELFVEPLVIIFLGALIGLIILGVFHPMARN